MKVSFKDFSKYLFQWVVLVVFTLTFTACASLQPVADENASEAEDHNHDAEDHSHDGEDDGHSEEQGSTVIGDTEVKIDHHGNPVFDEEERVYEQYIQDGVSIEFTLENFLGVGGRGGELAPRIVAGEHAVLQFHITDSASGQPLAGLKPAVWLDLGVEQNTPETCRQRVQGYLTGTLDARPVVDMNSYFILGMNQENTISVIDPMVDVAGMTNLFAIILLQGTPHDWVMTADHLKLFVTMTELSKVAVVDLDGYQVEANLDLEGRPVRIDIQPDGRYAWVGVESQKRSESGVAVIDVASQTLALQIPTGEGTHSLAFSIDSRYAYVTNSDAGTLTVIDAQSLEVVKDLSVGSQPVSVAVAPDAGAVYVSEQLTGSIYVIDNETLEITSQMQVDPGVAALKVSPDSKWGFAVNPQAEKIYVFEAFTNRITHVVPVKGSPDQVTFTDTAAYFRSSSSPAMFVIPFAEIDPQGNVSVLTVPVGNLPPNSSDASSVAQAVYSTPDNAALLVANPADDKIYFYVEGAQSALGGYQGHTLVPRAVQVVDRSLKERSPGIYTGGVRIPQSGEFTVALMLNDPQIVHCFQFTAKPNLELEGLESIFQPELKLLTLDNPKVGETFTFQFELTHSDTGEPVEGLEDLLVLVKMVAGNWSQRLTASGLGNGIYQIQLTFTTPGRYSLLFAAPSRGLNFDRLPQRTIQVVKE